MMVFLPFLETWEWGRGWSDHLGEARPLQSADKHLQWLDDPISLIHRPESWRSEILWGSWVHLLFWFTAMCCADVGLCYSGGWRHTFIIYTFLLRDSWGSRMRSELRSAKRMVIFRVPCDIQTYPQLDMWMVFCTAQTSIKLYYH